MKQITTTFFLLLFSTCLWAQKTKEFTLNFNEGEFSYFKIGDRINIVSKDNKAVIWGDSIDPALPYYETNILIDPTEDFIGISYELKEALVMNNVIIENNPINNPTYIENNIDNIRQVYYSPKTYPDNNIVYTGSHTMDGYKFLSFVVCPFKYDAKNKKLYLITDLNFENSQEICGSNSD